MPADPPNLIRIMPAKGVAEPPLRKFMHAAAGSGARSHLLLVVDVNRRLTMTRDQLAERRSWRTVDVVVAAVLAVAVGVVFWAWNLLWTAVGGAFTAFPPGQAFMYGVWLVPGVLGMLIIRKPGAALFTSLLASIVSALLGTPWSWSVVIYGLLQGLAPEVVFLATRYRRFALPVAMVAAAAAGVAAASLDWFYFYRDWTAGWIATYSVVLTASAIVVAGIGSWYLVKQLARTGVLDAFPAGRERSAL